MDSDVRKWLAEELIEIKKIREANPDEDDFAPREENEITIEDLISSLQGKYEQHFTREAFEEILYLLWSRHYATFPISEDFAASIKGVVLAWGSGELAQAINEMNQFYNREIESIEGD